jgi:hypothetical protein
MVSTIGWEGLWTLAVVGNHCGWQHLLHVVTGIGSPQPVGKTFY